MDRALGLHRTFDFDFDFNARCAEGGVCGLKINWDKIFQMGICTLSIFSRLDGTPLEKERELISLDGLISCDGRVNCELNKKMSEGRSILYDLRNLWL